MWSRYKLCFYFDDLKQVLSMEHFFDVSVPTEEAFKQKYDKLYEFVNNLKMPGDCSWDLMIYTMEN